MGNENEVWSVVIATSKDIDELVRRLRKNIGEYGYPKADALFETSAEVLLGLKKAYDDFLRHEERAWH